PGAGRLMGTHLGKGPYSVNMTAAHATVAARMKPANTVPAASVTGAPNAGSGGRAIPTATKGTATHGQATNPRHPAVWPARPNTPGTATTPSHQAGNSSRYCRPQPSPEEYAARLRSALATRHNVPTPTSKSRPDFPSIRPPGNRPRRLFARRCSGRIYNAGR